MSGGVGYLGITPKLSKFNRVTAKLSRSFVRDFLFTVTVLWFQKVTASVHVK